MKLLSSADYLNQFVFLGFRHFQQGCTSGRQEKSRHKQDFLGHCKLSFTAWATAAEAGVTERKAAREERSRKKEEGTAREKKMSGFCNYKLKLGKIHDQAEVLLAAFTKEPGMSLWHLA